MVVHAVAYDWSLHKVTHRGALTLVFIESAQTKPSFSLDRTDWKSRFIQSLKTFLIWLENNDSVQFQELVALVLNCLTVVAQCTESLIGGGDKSWVEFKELQE